jgi:flagellar motility protein MotE (MotC chaperone)
MMLRLLAAFCVGTVLTQLIMLGYFATRGTLNGDTITKTVALVNGIDITGERLRQVLQKSDQIEQPNFEEVLRQRTLTGTEMDLRLRSQQTYENELTRLLEDLKTAEARFDQRREAFERKLDDVKRNAQADGIKELQRTLQSLPVEQAKVQILKFYEAGQIDDVVNIIQGIPLDIRKDIMAEFVEPAEAEKLHDILRRIGNGQPLSSYVDEAKQAQ